MIEAQPRFNLFNIIDIMQIINPTKCVSKTLLCKLCIIFYGIYSLTISALEGAFEASLRENIDHDP